MRAVVAHAFGMLDALSIEEIDPAPISAHDVRIAVHAAALSFVDALIAEGRYQLKPDLPYTPGCECAGIVEAVGSAVESLEPGDRVCVAALGGAFGELMTVRAAAAVRVPDSMDFIQAAVFHVSYATAYHALVQRAALLPGETLLVLGAGGAIGSAAVQLGKAFGAHVIASASSEEKRARARRAGADATIDSRSVNWRSELTTVADGRRIDVVIDPVGGAQTERAFRSLGWCGRHVVIGFASGSIPALPTNLALLKGSSLIGVEIRQFNEREATVAAQNTAALFDLYGRGVIGVEVAHVLAFERFADAFALAARGESSGRIVLRVRS